MRRKLDVAESERDALQQRVAELERELATVRRDFASTAVRLTDVEGQLYDLRHAAKTPKQRLVIENQQLNEELGRLSGELTAAVTANYTQLQADFEIVCEERDALKREVEEQKELVHTYWLLCSRIGNAIERGKGWDYKKIPDAIQALKRDLAIERRVSEEVFDAYREAAGDTAILALDDWRAQLAAEGGDDGN